MKLDHYKHESPLTPEVVSSFMGDGCWWRCTPAGRWRWAGRQWRMWGVRCLGAGAGEAHRLLCHIKCDIRLLVSRLERIRVRSIDVAG